MPEMHSPYIDQYQACFYVLGGSVHPHEITRRLQIEPSWIHEKGSPRISQLGSPGRIYPDHLWGFSSPLMVHNENAAEAHIEFILNALEPHSDVLNQLAKEAELFMEIQCLLSDDYQSTSYVVGSSLLVRLARLNIRMGHVFRLAKNTYQDWPEMPS